MKMLARSLLGEVLSSLYNFIGVVSSHCIAIATYLYTANRNYCCNYLYITMYFKIIRNARTHAHYVAKEAYVAT